MVIGLWQTNPCSLMSNPSPALTAVWSKAPPLTARCLSPLHGFEIPAWACEKVASDLGLGGGFLLGTPVSSTTYNWLVTN